MNFKDKLDEAVYTMKLLGMSIEKKDALRKIDNLCDDISEHLVKIVLIDSDESRKHWVTEINAWLYKINSIYVKTKSKRLSYKEVYGHLIETGIFFDTTIVVRTVSNRYKRDNMKIRNISPDKVKKLVESILSEFSEHYVNKTFDGLQNMKSYQKALKEIERYK